MLKLLKNLFFIIVMLISLSSCSKTSVVENFLDAEISGVDSSSYLGEGINSSRISSYTVLSYEIKQTSNDVVIAEVVFSGVRTTSQRFGPNRKEYIEMPETIRFRVSNGKIIEIL